MLRNIGAVLLGLIVGMAMNMALITLNMAIFPGPPGLDFNDNVAMSAYIETLPQTAFILVLLAHMAQAAGGGWIAARVGGSHPIVLAMIVGVLTLIGGVIMLVQMPGPVCMWIEVPLYLALPFALGWLEGRRRLAKAAG